MTNNDFIIKDGVLEKYVGPGGDVVIPEGVTSINDSAFYDCTNLQSITISDSVTSIGSDAFSNCENLKSLTIPDSVSEIGYHSFAACTNLETVKLGNGVENIGTYAFEDCRNLTSVDFGNNIKNIGYMAFHGCDNFESITIPDSIRHIGGDAFSGYSIKEAATIVYQGTEKQWEDLMKNSPNWDPDFSNVFLVKDNTLVGYSGPGEDVIIPEGITIIDDFTFDYCQSLTSITIPDSVTRIGDFAFHGCTNLPSVTIPDSVTSIGDYAFYGCKFKDVYYTGTKEQWEELIKNSPDCGLKSRNIHFLGEKEKSDITADDNVAKDDKVDDVVRKFAEMKIKELDEKIEKCFEVPQQLNIRDEQGMLIRMPNNILCECHSRQKDIVVPDDVIKIGSLGFAFNKSLESITIPDGVTSIGEKAFCGCENLASIIIPDSVTEIGEQAFCDCTNLKSVTLPSHLTAISPQMFCNCKSLESIIIPDSIKSIGYTAFYNCENLKSITIGAGVKYIKSDSFDKCANLTDVCYAGTKEQWNELMKNNYHCGLEYKKVVCLENKETEIDSSDSAMHYETQSMPNTAETQANAINSNFIIKDGILVKYDGDAETITIPDTVKVIEEEAFADCIKAKIIEMPKSVEEIHDFAFHGCCSLTDIHYEGNESEWNNIEKEAYAFNGLGPVSVHLEMPITIDQPEPEHEWGPSLDDIIAEMERNGDFNNDTVNEIPTVPIEEEECL